MQGFDVLILDDDQNILNSLKRLFHNETFKPYITDNIDDALKIIGEENIKVVISDYKMPVMTGVDFLEKVKQKNSNTVRILFTGHSEKDVLEDAINRGGVFKFLNKPLNPQMLRAVIRKAVEMHDESKKANDVLDVIKNENEKLKEDVQLKSDFVANICHEFKTPLTSMQLIFDNISEGILCDFDKLPPEMKEYLDLANRKAKELNFMANDLLSVFKMSFEGLSISRKDADIGKIIQSEVDDMSSLACDRGINLVSKVISSVIVSVDEMRIKQVVRNLISNAIKFTSGGGNILVSLEKEDKNIICKVKDDGMGIEEKDIERIFGKYQQSKQTEESKKVGTGLGLAICKEIIKMHGGEIWAQSQPGQGSTFIFTIPLSG